MRLGVRERQEYLDYARWLHGGLGSVRWRMDRGFCGHKLKRVPSSPRAEFGSDPIALLVC